METELLTLAEAAQALRLRSPANFTRFARRHSIPLIRLGSRVVRVRASDLEQVVERHAAHPAECAPNAT